MHRRGQVWSLDALVAMVIFVFALILLFFYALNFSDQSSRALDRLQYQGITASELLLSEDSSYGLLTNNVIDQSKVDAFSALAYDDTRHMLGVEDDYYFTFTGMLVNGNPVTHLGQINATPVESIVKVTRIAVYQQKPVVMEVFIWND